ncbi:MAG: nucleoside triphosphate pyrophosphohydrolase [Bacteroidetes bacterium]|nr:nucleoside triphosphate pyrophosphohydrolase [Bacteroidota bacterium]
MAEQDKKDYNKTDKETLEKFKEFVDVVYRLRKECPWDKEQTHQSLRRCLLEESYEVLEAIDKNDKLELKKELGDLILQVIFHSILGEETGDFTLKEVLEGETAKLIYRHPHVFGEKSDINSTQVKQNWEKLKMKEGRNSVIDGIPAELPALFKAYRMQEKASKIGFDWKEKEPVYNKILEEVNELKENIEAGKPHEDIEDEFGDVLFSIVNYARFINVNPEDALRRTIEKFSSRFREMEKGFIDEGRDIHALTLEEMDERWNQIKKKK